MSDWDTSQGAHSLLWLGCAVGTAAAIATLVYSLKTPSRWDQASRRMDKALDRARDEAKPWMGLAAAAAIGTALAFTQRPRQSAWQQARGRASALITRTAKQARPWVRVAADKARELRRVPAFVF